VCGEYDKASTGGEQGQPAEGSKLHRNDVQTQSADAGLVS